jgi:hypothetical protein
MSGYNMHIIYIISYKYMYIIYIYTDIHRDTYVFKCMHVCIYIYIFVYIHTIPAHGTIHKYT